MPIRIALYRGRHSGRLGPRLLAWWMACDWSHALILWQLGQPDSDGDLRAQVSEATASAGIRTWWRDWVPGLWDVYELDGDVTRCWTWWMQHEGGQYSWRAIAGFVLRRITDHSTAAVCSEAVVESATPLPDAWRWDVAMLACYLRAHGRPVTHDQLLQEHGHA